MTVTCGVTAKRSGLAPSPTLVNRVWGLLAYLMYINIRIFVQIIDAVSEVHLQLRTTVLMLSLLSTVLYAVSEKLLYCDPMIKRHFKLFLCVDKLKYQTSLIWVAQYAQYRVLSIPRQLARKHYVLWQTSRIRNAHPRKLLILSHFSLVLFITCNINTYSCSKCCHLTRTRILSQTGNRK